MNAKPTYDELKTAKRHWLNEGQATVVVILRERGDRVTVRTESGAMFTVGRDELY